MLFVVFVATIERLFGFFSCCERVTYFQVVMTGKTLKQKKKIKKEKGNNSSSSSSQPHAGDNCFSQTLKLCDFWRTLLVVLPDISLISTLIEIFWKIPTS